MADPEAVAVQMSNLRALLVHEGELSDVKSVLGELGGEATERSGPPTPEEQREPWDLVVATARYALKLETPLLLSPTTCVAVLDQDSAMLRSMLREGGLDYIVRRPVHPAALRLLILYSLYRGPENRQNERVTIGAPVRIKGGLLKRQAILSDLSMRGCLLFSRQKAQVGDAMRLFLPAELGLEQPLVLRGEVVRSRPAPSAGRGLRGIALAFEGLTPDLRQSLRSLLDGYKMGPAVLPEALVTKAPGPVARSDVAARSATTPERAVAAPERARSEPEAPPVPEPASAARNEGSERRDGERRSFRHHVTALDEEADRVLIGRDISLGGMRVDPGPLLQRGAALRLRLHGGGEDEPLIVAARVHRDDGEAGVVLRFVDLGQEDAARLERILEDLPLAALPEAGPDWAGALISEVLSEGVEASAP